MTAMSRKDRLRDRCSIAEAVTGFGSATVTAPSAMPTNDAHGPKLFLRQVDSKFGSHLVFVLLNSKDAGQFTKSAH